MEQRLERILIADVKRCTGKRFMGMRSGEAVEALLVARAPRHSRSHR